MTRCTDDPISKLMTGLNSTRIVAIGERYESVGKIWCIAWILMFALGTCTASFPIESYRTIEGFTHTAWGEKEGAPRRIYAITQTKDGYLWLASDQGLFRFDGITFEHYATQTGPAIPADRAYSLLALPNGDLWVSFTSGTISLLRSGQAWNYTTRDGVPEGIVLCLARDREGTIWTGTTTGLARLEGNRWKEVGREWNFTGKTVRALLVDSKGTLWAATDDTIVYLPQGSRIFQSTAIRVGPVTQLIEAPNSKLWMSETTRSVRPIPLGVKLPPSDTVEIRVGSQAILFDREGDLWIPTLGDGVCRTPVPEQLRGKPGRFSSAVESFTTKDGLTDNRVMSVFQDHEGDIWVGTQSGLDRFRKANLKQVRLASVLDAPILVPDSSGAIWAFLDPEGALHIRKSSIDAIKTPSMIQTAYRESSGVMWLISMTPALLRFENGHFSHFPLPKEVLKSLARIIRITEDSSGVLWMAVEQQGLFRLERGTWSRFDVPPELAKLNPATAFTDDLGRAWFGYGEGTIIYLDGGKIQTVAKRQNSPAKNLGVIRGRNKHVWVGGHSGLFFFDRDNLHQVVPVDRPSFERVSGIEELADGSLWLCEPHDVIHIAAPEVRKFLESPSYHVHYEVFDSRDGLPGTFRNAGQKLVEGSDGRIWFATDHGIAWLNPATIPPSVPPPVSIRSISAGGKRFAFEANLTFPPRSKDLHVEYTTLNLSNPERVRYRYKLDGIDKDWQDAGIRREAFYTNLGPGKYTFHMTARNEGGEWSTEEATLDFRIAPAWFQTIWFQAFCGCVFLSLLWMLYQLRLRQLQRQFNRALEARVSERSRIARELHDTLLQSFQGVVFLFQGATNLLPAGEAKQKLEGALDQAEQAIVEGRDAVHEMRSSEDASELSTAIHAFAEGLMASRPGEGSPVIRVRVEGAPRALNAILYGEIYRIAVEALRNAFQHAQAHQIEVEIIYGERQLLLRVRDDGKGVDADTLEHGRSGHFGLPGMRERARLIGAGLEVRSTAGSGTEVELAIASSIAYTKSRPMRRWFFRLFRSG